MSVLVGLSIFSSKSGLGWGDEVSLHENSHSHSQSLRVFEVEVRGFKIFEAFLRLRVM